MPPKLHLTDDPLIMRDGHGVAYTERPCEGCGNLAWMQKERGRFCSRPCARLNQGQCGENSPNWVGNDISYSGMHKRIEKIRGRADRCIHRNAAHCTSQRFEWAWIHGQDPLDIYSYVQLFKFCHLAYDTDNTGSKNGRARLTEEIVIECRRRSAAGETKKALAREFGVTPTAVYYAVTGQTWRHIPVPA